MKARELCSALGGRWRGTYGYVRCVAHDDGRPSLRLRDGEKGLLVYCHAGCDAKAILDGLKARRLLGARTDEVPDTADEIREREAKAKAKQERDRHTAYRIWKHTRPIEGSSSERFQRNRLIVLPLPKVLRHTPALRCPEDGKKYNAMVAATQFPDGRFSGIHRTFHTPDGRKVDLKDVRFTLGFMSGCAVRLADPAEEMAVCEGIETGLAFMQLTGIPTWAALNTSGLQKVALPPLPFARVVYIAADFDANKAGEIAAERAAARFREEGRDVHIQYPANGLKDFNDVLMVPHAA